MIDGSEKCNHRLAFELQNSVMFVKSAVTFTCICKPHPEKKGIPIIFIRVHQNHFPHEHGDKKS